MLAEFIVDLFMGEATWSLNLEEEIDNLFTGQTIFPERSNWMKLKENESEDFDEEHGRDTLTVACIQGELAVAQKLLLQGADVDCRDTHDYTPLMVAVEHNHESLVHLLLQNGADVNLISEEGSNALFLAAKLKHKKIVQALLEQEDKVHISEAVLFASQNGFTDIAELLLQSMGWWTPLIHLANKTHGSILEVRTSNELMEPVDSSYTALMIAALLGHAETVETLLKTGSEVDKQTGDGWTALMLAVCFRHQKVTELLLQHRATANLYTMDGKTALQMAAFNGYTNLVDLLCQNGADINLAPYFKFSPLILAASNGHTKVVETLLKYRCNVWYRAPISEKIDMRQKPGQGKYRRRSSGSSKKYLRAVDMSVLFGFNECTQILQQEMKSDRCISAELPRVKDDMQCEGPCDVFEDETVKHKHKELCNKNNRRHGVFLSANELDTFMKQLKDKEKPPAHDVSRSSSLSQDENKRESSSSEETLQDINASYVRQLLNAYCIPTHLRVVKNGANFCVYFNQTHK